jgi:tetratricopeptide (TPR) repeat protein
MSVPSIPLILSAPPREPLIKFEEVTPANQIVAFFDSSLKYLVAHLNIPIYLGYDELDEILFAFLTLPSGQTVVLGQYKGSSQMGVDLYVDPSIKDVSTAVYESCQQLGTSRKDVIWLHSDFQEEVDRLYANHGDFPQRKKILSIDVWPQNSDYEPIECFEKALTIYTEQEIPIFWATLQRNLGLAYYYRLRGDRRDNLQKSIKCYENSIQVYTKKDFSVQWNILNKEINNAYRELEKSKESSFPLPIKLSPHSNLKMYVVIISLLTTFIGFFTFSKLHISSYEVTTEPEIKRDSIIYPYLQVSDKAGRTADINVVILSSKYRWKIGQDRLLEDPMIDNSTIKIDDFNRILEKDGIYELIRSEKGVSRIITVGTASCEGAETIEEARAESRALFTIELVAKKMFNVSKYSFINLGQFNNTSCSRSIEKTDWQRAIVIIGVKQEDDRINLTEAVRKRLLNLPVRVEEYSLGGEKDFKVRDHKDR